MVSKASRLASLGLLAASCLVTHHGVAQTAAGSGGEAPPTAEPAPPPSAPPAPQSPPPGPPAPAPGGAAPAPQGTAPPSAPGYGAPQPGYGTPPAYGSPPGYGPAPPGYGAQPGYGYGAQPPYGYGAQPGYGAPPGQLAWPPQPPPVMPYSEGQPVPAGYHVDERVRRGPLIAGLAMGGAMYMLGLAVAGGDNFDNAKGWLLLPVAGPWLTIAFRARCETRTTTSLSGSSFSTCNSDDDVTARTLLVFDGLAQAAGAALVVVGLAIPRLVLVRDDVAHVEITPATVGRGGQGVRLVGTF